MDKDSIESWIRLAKESGLTLLSIEEDDWGIEICLPRRPFTAVNVAQAITEQRLEESSEPKSESIEIKSRWVGFFRNPSEKFVAGADVEADEILGEVETLGLSNVITVPARGSLREVLVHDGDPVQYGQTVAILEPKP